MVFKRELSTQREQKSMNMNKKELLKLADKFYLKSKNDKTFTKKARGEADLGYAWIVLFIDFIKHE